MGGRGAPVEAPCDHGVVVDHSELVWLVVQKSRPALFLRVSVGRSAANEASEADEAGMGQEHGDSIHPICEISIRQLDQPKVYSRYKVELNHQWQVIPSQKFYALNPPVRAI